MKEIKTKRLFLRKPADSNKQDLINQIGNINVSQSLTNVPYPYTMDHASEWLKTINQRAHKYNYSIFLNLALIGGVSLILKDDGCYELGYWLGENFWGNGYATEAAKGLLSHIFENEKNPKITSGYLQGNIASANVLSKLGFKKTGEVETYVLSLDKSLTLVNTKLGFE